jgi:hypothetical protein
LGSACAPYTHAVPVRNYVSAALRNYVSGKRLNLELSVPTLTGRSTSAAWPCWYTARYRTELSRIGLPLLCNGAAGELLGGLVLFLIMAGCNATRGWWSGPCSGATIPAGRNRLRLQCALVKVSG